MDNAELKQMNDMVRAAMQNPDEQVRALELSCSFAEKVLKQYYCSIVGKTVEEIFGEVGRNETNKMIFEPKEARHGRCQIHLDIVTGDYQLDVMQFKDMPDIFEKMNDLMSCAMHCWDYLIYLDKKAAESGEIPERRIKLDIWRDPHGTLKIAGAPPSAKQIGIIVTKL